MASAKTFLVWTALSGAVFSVQAQEIIERGNQKQPYEPPAWFSRLASPELLRPREPEVLTWLLDVSTVIGRPHPGTPKKACRVKTPEGEKWSFCEL